MYLARLIFTINIHISRLHILRYIVFIFIQQLIFRSMSHDGNVSSIIQVKRPGIHTSIMSRTIIWTFQR